MQHIPHYLVLYDLEVRQDQQTICMVAWCIYNTMDASWTEIKYCVNFDLWLLNIVRLLHTQDVFLMAHNGRKYDHLFVANALSKHRGMWHTVGNTRVLQLEVWDKHGHRMHFRDSKSWDMRSIEQLGDAFQMPKLTMDIDDPAYCMRDVEIMRKLWEVVHTTWDAEDVPHRHCRDCLIQYYSAAHLVYVILMSRTIDDHYVFNLELYNATKSAYIGARVDSQVFGQHIIDDIAGIDIVSMYPAAFNNPMPFGVLREGQWQPGIHYLQQQPALILARVYKSCTTINSRRYGLCALRLSDCTCYTDNGDITKWFTSIDLWVLQQDGWSVLEIKQTLQFQGWSNDFQTTFLHYFDIKQSHKGQPSYDAAKAILNSGYGKFVQKVVNEPTKPFQIGWFVLAYTRVQHLQLKQLTMNCPVLYYGDTDSLFMPRSYILQLQQTHPEIFSANLGTWKCISVAMEPHSSCIIVCGKKMMYMDNKCSQKGVYGKTLTKDDYLSMINGSVVPVYGEIPAGRFIEFDDNQIVAGVLPWHPVCRNIRITIPDYIEHVDNYTVCRFIQQY